MTINLQIAPNDFSTTEVRETLTLALAAETRQAKARRDYFAEQCVAFEQAHLLSSDNFLDQFDAGTLGDDAVYFDWYAAKRGLDLWTRRHQILSDISA